MTYDHWKATNPVDEWLGPEPEDDMPDEPDDDDGYDFPPPRYPRREGFTMALAVIVVLASVAAAVLWLSHHVTVTLPCRVSTINHACQ